MAPLVRRSWAPAGHTPILRQRMRHYQKLSVMAALVVSPGRRGVRLYFKNFPDVNIDGATVATFLRHLHRHRRGHIFLLWDRLTAHRAAIAREFLRRHRRIHPEFLPPYAPELNPVEGVWGYLKLNPLSNFAPPDLSALVSRARRGNRSLQRKPNLLRSFIHHCPLPLRLR
jgi:transposase